MHTRQQSKQCFSKLKFYLLVIFTSLFLLQPWASANTLEATSQENMPTSQQEPATPVPSEPSSTNTGSSINQISIRELEEAASKEKELGLVSEMVGSTGLNYSFQDLNPQRWSWEHIKNLVSQGVMNGKANDFFGAADPATWGEAAKVIVKASGGVLENCGQNPFSDIAQGKDWFYEYAVCGASKYNFIPVNSNGLFSGNQPMSRYDFAALLLKAFGLQHEAEAQSADSAFSDVPQGHWAAKTVALLKSKGVISGFQDGTFRGNEPVTREQMAKLTDLMMKLKDTTEPLAACTKEYMPVCGEVENACDTAPCEPVRVTFANQCEAEAGNAQDITPGACADEEPSPEGACLSFDGLWNPETKECQGMGKEQCEALEGTHTECASPCQNDPLAEVCIDLCMPVCQF